MRNIGDKIWEKNQNMFNLIVRTREDKTIKIFDFKINLNLYFILKIARKSHLIISVI